MTPGYYAITQYATFAAPPAGQNMSYQWQAGLLIKATDNTNNKSSSYVYDREGRCTNMSLTANGILVRELDTTYDEMSREIVT